MLIVKWCAAYSLTVEGADVNFRAEDDQGQTPLHAAATNGNTAIVHMLLQVQLHDSINDMSLTNSDTTWKLYNTVSLCHVNCHACCITGWLYD